MPIVETVSGKVRGAIEDGVAAFRGVPYAAPPVGLRRFRPPDPPEPWTGVRDALDYGPIAMQHLPPRPDNSPMPSDGYFDSRSAMDEDCLVVHVWTPGTVARRRPVMVWCHGGGFSNGSGHGRWADGATLAREEDVVVVGFNHRLHAFGFLFLGGLGAEDFADSGNAGMLDIVAVLQWVRDNIAAFGGDPGNVTVFGESGGGWKISALRAMPAAEGLFHKAIIQSGSHLRAVSAEHADRTARLLLAELEVPENAVERIYDVPADRLVAATTRAYPEDVPARIFPDGTWTWNFDLAPVIDGRSLNLHPFHPDAPPEPTGIPLMIGTTRDEFGADTASEILPGVGDPIEKATRLGMAPEAAQRIVEVYRADRPASSDDDLFGELLSDTLFFMPAIRQAEAKIRQGAGPVYSYLFSWGWSRAGDRAVHAIDVPLVFGNLGPEVLGTAHDDSTRALSARMRAAWAAFARTGDPSHPGIPRWEPYTLAERATMIFDHDCRVENDPRAERRRALDATTWPVEERPASAVDGEETTIDGGQRVVARGDATRGPAT